MYVRHTANLRGHHDPDRNRDLPVTLSTAAREGGEGGTAREGGQHRQPQNVPGATTMEGQ